MPWWYAVVESRHGLQNPTSPEKIRRLGELLGLGPSLRVLDVPPRRGGPAVLLASELGCRITLVELSAEFRERGRRQRERYLRWKPGLLGWAISIARVR
jgi:cyclopropane fatty-acyl-phospholipid synthase-like methyltransferase